MFNVLFSIFEWLVLNRSTEIGQWPMRTIQEKVKSGVYCSSIASKLLCTFFSVSSHQHCCSTAEVFVYSRSAHHYQKWLNKRYDFIPGKHPCNSYVSKAWIIHCRLKAQVRRQNLWKRLRLRPMPLLYNSRLISAYRGSDSHHQAEKISRTL